MSHENVAAVEAAYTAFAQGGLDRFIEHWTDDLDHRSIEGAPDDRGPIHGKAALRAYVQDWIETFDEFKIEPVELIDLDDDKVVAVLRFGGRAKLSGVETDSTMGVVFTIRHGMVARGRECATPACGSPASARRRRSGSHLTAPSSPRLRRNASHPSSGPWSARVQKTCLSCWNALRPHTRGNGPTTT